MRNAPFADATGYSSEAAVSNAPHPGARRPYSARRSGDRLTILQVMLLTVGVAAGMTIANSADLDFEDFNLERSRALAVATMMGLSLVAGLLTLRRRFRGYALNVGGVMNLAVGWAIVLLGPALLLELFRAEEDVPSMFLFVYMVPLLPLWGVLAGFVTHRIDRRRLGTASPWSERLGLYLALLWALLGVWVLVDLYSATF